MGHIRLGRLPKTKAWSQVFELLKGDSISPDQLAKSVATAAERHLAVVERAEGINYCFWVLVRVTTAARGDNFTDELAQLGIETETITSGLAFVQQVGQAIEKGIRRRVARTVLAQMAELSLKEVLSGRIVEESRSLFGTGLREIQSACRMISTQKRFGEVAKEFFAKFTARTIRYITDRNSQTTSIPLAP